MKYHVFPLQSKSITKESDGTMTYETTAGVFKGFDCVLFAVGRTPNTDLCLDKAVSINLLSIFFFTDKRTFFKGMDTVLV